MQGTEKACGDGSWIRNIGPTGLYWRRFSVSTNQDCSLWEKSESRWCVSRPYTQKTAPHWHPRSSSDSRTQKYLFYISADLLLEGNQRDWRANQEGAVHPAGSDTPHRNVCLFSQKGPSRLQYDWFPLMDNLLKEWTKDQIKKNLYIPVDNDFEKIKKFRQEGFVFSYLSALRDDNDYWRLFLSAKSLCLNETKNKKQSYRRHKQRIEIWTDQ